MAHIVWRRFPRTRASGNSSAAAATRRGAMTVAVAMAMTLAMTMAVTMAVPPRLRAQDANSAAVGAAYRAAEAAAKAAAERLGPLRALFDAALLSSRIAEYDQLLAFLDRELERTPHNAVLHHYRGYALYRKASVLAATSGEERRDSKTIKAMFEEADHALERASVGLSWPETLALRAVVTGQLIAYSGPFSAIRLGPRSSRLLNEAVESGPDNPRVWMLRGVADLHKPRLFGGSVDKAEAELRRALVLFETDAPAPPAPWWGHAETYGWLGQVLVKQGQFAQARAAYKQALVLQPGNTWVSELLLPALDHASR